MYGRRPQKQGLTSFSGFISMQTGASLDTLIERDSQEWWEMNNLLYSLKKKSMNASICILKKKLASTKNLQNQLKGVSVGRSRRGSFDSSAESGTSNSTRGSIRAGSPSLRKSKAFRKKQRSKKKTLKHLLLSQTKISDVKSEIFGKSA